MKYIALFALFAVAAGSLNGAPDDVRQPVDSNLKHQDGIPNSMFDNAWNNFKSMFDKTYDPMQELNRRLNFESTVVDITEHNLLTDLGFNSYKLGVNKYSDLSPEEVSKQLFGFNGYDNYTNEPSRFTPSTTAAQSSVDWRKKGLVTPVKDQGQCGSCWSFSATGALEGQMKKKTGKLVSLSEQNLIDCSHSEGNAGCNGGFMNQAFTYVKSNGGIDTEDSYPYVEKDGSCSFTAAGVGGTVTGFVDIPSGNEGALKKAVSSVGPVSVAINANGDFFSYQSGIYSPILCPNTIYDLNHAVLAVGYGTENGQDYWLLKNSWGKSYGIDGYIKLARNRNNLCGIATKASYPLV